MRVTLTTTAKRTAQTMAAIGSSASAPPPVAAMPLPPPRNLRAAGQTWPATAPSQAAPAAGQPHTSQAARVGAKPLAMSPATTTRPARLPPRRYTLEAPGLPDPSLCGSRPIRRPTKDAVGNMPMA